MNQQRNIFYYSNHCKHSQKTLNMLVKAGLEQEVLFICIDKRGRDQNTNQIFILMQNGERVLLPPNVHSVPSLLLVNEQYRVIYGDEIAKHYESRIMSEIQTPSGPKEPIGFTLGGGGVGGQSFGTSYGTQQSIITPPDNYASNKIRMGDDVALSQYEQERKMMDAQMGIGQQPKNPFIPH